MSSSTTFHDSLDKIVGDGAEEQWIDNVVHASPVRVIKSSDMSLEWELAYYEEKGLMPVVVAANLEVEDDRDKGMDVLHSDG